MKRKWFKLDNAAKIFPPSSTKKDAKVFRFVCELKEEIESSVLQQAVNYALEIFPSFRVVMKHGIFWYYLESTDLIPKVKLENKPICFPIYSKNRKRLLFRVSYYKHRINLEVFHALSDGTGALEFLKCIVTEYCNQKYNKQIPISLEGTFNELADDSFEKYYTHQPSTKKEKVSIYHFKGEKFSNYRMKVIEGSISVSKMLELSKKYHTTLTVFITSIYILSILQTMSLKDRKKTVIIDIPVNLRKYFSSVTSRNFFSVCKIPYRGEENLENIIHYVDQYLKKELEKENLFKKMNEFAVFAHNYFIRVIPLFLKNFILKVVSIFTEKTMTSSVSNVGIIQLPKELEVYVQKFSVLVSTSKLQMCLCSYLDTLNIAFTSVFTSTDVPKNFFRTLQSLGLDITIIASEVSD